jgi:predicted GIY-YIG superfamily endonuclease
MTEYTLYWVKTNTHFDIKTQGYVGITKNFKKRMWEHNYKSKKVDNTFQRAIRKYGWTNLNKEIIYTGDKESCELLEELLRPKEYIGWNVCKGGFAPKAPTEEQKAATSLRCKGKPGTPHTQEFKEALRIRNMKYLYTITHPDGTIETTNCLKDWCETNNIRQNCMQRVASGRRSQHKGYRCTRVAI